MLVFACIWGRCWLQRWQTPLLRHAAGVQLKGGPKTLCAAPSAWPWPERFKDAWGAEGHKADKQAKE